MGRVQNNLECDLRGLTWYLYARKIHKRIVKMKSPCLSFSDKFSCCPYRIDAIEFLEFTFSVFGIGLSGAGDV